MGAPGFDFDVVVIGAGAAGIGAGRRLRALGLSFIVLEARARLGGRAHTDNATLGIPWDRGCHWFHTADRNPLREEADRLGHPYERKRQPPVAGLFSGGEWRFDGQAREQVWAAMD